MKTYIIHVSDATDREKQIKDQLKGKKLDPIFVCEGDIKDISQEVLDSFFKGRMYKVNAQVSCAYKHILSYQKIAESGNEISLILEDDISFYSDFENNIEKLLSEIKRRELDNFVLSIEDSTLNYIARSKREKGVLIYPEKYGRTNGAYLIDKKGAQSILDYAKENKIDRPIDFYHNLCIEKGSINMYWSQPAFCRQGSLDGSTKSLIDNKRLGLLRVLSFKAQRVYKKLLYNFR